MLHTEATLVTGLLVVEVSIKSNYSQKCSSSAVELRA